MGTLAFFLLVLGGFSGASAQTGGEVFTAEDMLDIVTFAPDSIAVSPNGDYASYVLPDMTEEWNVLERNPVGYLSVQRLVTSGPAEPRALTRGKTRSSFGVWSPAGTKLAFFVEEPEGGRLAIWDRETEETRIYGDRFTGRAYLAPQWSPSGDRVFYAPAAREEEPKPPARVRVVESSDRRIPGDEFFLDKRRAGLAFVEVSSGKMRSLVEESVPLRSFSLSPRGDDLLYTMPSPETFGIVGDEKNETFVISTEAEASARRLTQNGKRLSWMPDGSAALEVKEGKLFRVPLDGGEPLPFLPDLNLPVTAPLWSPDGSHFLTLVADESVTDPELEPPRPGMYTIARPFTDLYLVSAADGSAENLTAGFEDQVRDPLWSPDGKSVFFRTIDNQTYDEKIYRYIPGQRKLSVLIEGEESYSDIGAGTGKLVLAVEDAIRPRDLWWVDPEGGQRNRATLLNPQLSRFRFSQPELFYFYNADGEHLGALLYKPAGFQEGDHVPVITYVYEKLTPGIHQFSAPHQIFLNHGYAVLMPNVKVKVGQTATSFVKSVVPAVNAVRDMDVTNGKFALWGGSFGAYATAFVITQTNIFACAVARATPPELFRNWASGRDRDSRNIERGQARMGGGPFDFMERYLTQSAFFQLDKVETPVLIMHGVEDYTILFGEGEMMFYALRQLGKEATFVIYTHGDHSLSRHSRSDTLDVYRRMLDWFGKYLSLPGGGPVSLRVERN